MTIHASMFANNPPPIVAAIYSKTNLYLTLISTWSRRKHRHSERKCQVDPGSHLVSDCSLPTRCIKLPPQETDARLAQGKVPCFVYLFVRPPGVACSQPKFSSKILPTHNWQINRCFRNPYIAKHLSAACHESFLYGHYLRKANNITRKICCCFRRRF